tara:strand:+ start:676 stop:1008 length:333 start_codon:yes stop_codon:yes gene_type:complete
MKNLIILAGAVAILSACSSNKQPVMSQFKPQYCYQTTTINTTDGTNVNSKGVTECTDNPNNKHFLAYSEIAKDCREYWYDIWLNGKAVAQRGYVCQKINGEWEIVSHPYN